MAQIGAAVPKKKIAITYIYGLFYDAVSSSEYNSPNGVQF
jgi:hypothetical protein